MSNVVGSLVVNLLAQTAKFKGPIKESIKDIDDFGKHVGSVMGKLGGQGFGDLMGGLFSAKGLGAIGGGLTVKKVFEEFVTTANEAREKVKKAKDMDLDVGSYLAMEEQAGKVNLSMEQVDKSLDKMKKNIAEAAGGNKDLSRSFGQLGLEAKKLFDMKPETAFYELSKALMAVKNPMERTRLEMAVFGKGGADMDLLVEKAAKGPLQSQFQISPENTKALARFSQGWSEFWKMEKKGAGEVFGWAWRGLSSMLPGRAEAADDAAGGRTPESEEAIQKREALNKYMQTSWELSQDLAKGYDEESSKLRALGATESQIADAQGVRRYHQNLKEIQALLESTKKKASEALGPLAELRGAMGGKKDEAAGVDARIADLRAKGMNASQEKELRAAWSKQSALDKEIQARTQLIGLQERSVAANETEEETTLRRLSDLVGPGSTIVERARQELDYLKEQNIERANAESFLQNENRILQENARLMSPVEQFQESMRQIDRDRDSSMTQPGQAAAREMDAWKKQMQGLGIKTPMEDAIQQLRDLEQARDQLSPEAYAKRRKQILGAGALGMAGDLGTVSLPAAMSRFSKEAYSTITRAQYKDAATQLAEEQLQKLRSIDDNIRAMAEDQNTLDLARAN